MSIIDSLVVSLFCISSVFLVLAFLFALIKVLSKILGKMGDKAAKFSDAKNTVTQIVRTSSEADEKSISEGELKLVNVDEKTAAMIMAIVSHESKIPLSRLAFKSIKLIEEF